MASRTAVAARPANPSFACRGRFPRLRDFTTGSKQSDDKTAAQSRLNGVRPGHRAFHRGQLGKALSLFN